MTRRPSRALPASDARSGAHRAERRRWERRLAAGESFQCTCTGHCGRHTSCTTIITTGSRWDLGHTEDRTGWTGPECIPCNRGAGAINSNQRSSSMVVREWRGA